MVSVVVSYKTSTVWLIRLSLIERVGWGEIEAINAYESSLYFKIKRASSQIASRMTGDLLTSGISTIP